MDAEAELETGVSFRSSSIFSEERIEAVVNLLVHLHGLAYNEVRVGEQVMNEEYHEQQEDHDGARAAGHCCDLGLAAIVKSWRLAKGVQ